MSDKSNTGFRRLRKRVERALANGARGSDVLRDLEAIVREAAEGDRDALFAHRQLAELRLEESPWRAALHLRKLLASGAADDGVHALMGLSQAMLGNFRVAIASYRRAVEISPRNPWYHHNLGHLLDVGVGNARAAIKHLRFAYELEAAEDEIGASLAHCLARLGELDEARTLAEAACEAAPNNADHHALLQWVERGAPTGTSERRTNHEPRARLRGSAAAAARGPQNPTAPTQSTASGNAPALRGGASGNAPALRGGASGNAPALRGGASGNAPALRGGASSDLVVSLVVERMPQAGFTHAQVARAQALWTDFSGRRGPRGTRAEVYAAAIEYAMAVVHSAPGFTRAAIGRRYGVTPSAISNRFGEIRSVLGLMPGDPRYCVSMRG